jgi:hypothetical protein
MAPVLVGYLVTGEEKKEQGCRHVETLMLYYREGRVQRRDIDADCDYKCCRDLCLSYIARRVHNNGSTQNYHESELHIAGRQRFVNETMQKCGRGRRDRGETVWALRPRMCGTRRFRKSSFFEQPQSTSFVD